MKVFAKKGAGLCTFKSWIVVYHQGFGGGCQIVEEVRKGLIKFDVLTNTTMKATRLIHALTILNFIVLLFIAASPQRDKFDKITVTEFELVAPSGTQRASIKVEEDGAVVLRLRDAQGNIRVKLGSGEDGSGLVLLDSETNPGVHMLAKKKGSSITMLGADGKKKEF
jgi:hypothetical protein